MDHRQLIKPLRHLDFLVQVRQDGQGAAKPSSSVRWQNG
jgi:hypothetical protein